MEHQSFFISKNNGTGGGQTVSSHSFSRSYISDHLTICAMQPNGPSSFAAIVAAFIPTAVVAILYTTAFILVRRYYPNIYFPRTYIGTVPEKDRTPCQNRSRWDWVHTMRVVPDKFMLYHQSLD